MSLLLSSPQEAFAFNIVINSQESCEDANIGGSWDGGTSTCTIGSLTLTYNNGDIVTIAAGITLNVTGTLTINYGGEINNNAGGIINNNNAGGTIEGNEGEIDNRGIINNNAGGTIDSDGTFYNFDGGTFNNNAGGTINNSFLGIFDNFDGGTFNNNGTFYNNYRFSNGGTFNNFNGGTFNNSGGDIYNTGIINNNGTINNFNGGTINKSFGDPFNNDCAGTFDPDSISGIAAIDICEPEANDGSVTADEDTITPITITGTNPEVAGNPFENAQLTFFIQTQPENGTLSLAAGGNTTTSAELTYTPNPNFNGADSFTFVANDGTSNSLEAATVLITINAVNDPPVANAQSVTTNEDNDVEITLTGSDVESDPLSFIIVTQPENGTLAATGANTTTSAELTYTPNPNFNGADSFTFVANDGTSNSAPATVSITVNPVPEPQAGSNSGGGGGGGGGGGKRVVIVNNNNQQNGGSVTTYPESFFADNPLGRIGVTNSSLLNAFGVSVDVATVGQQVSITGTLSNHQQAAQDYSFIVQITNGDGGTVVFIGFQNGSLESGAMTDVSISWTPEVAGDYTVKIFVWDSLQPPAQPLSTVTAMNIEVTATATQ